MDIVFTYVNGLDEAYIRKKSMYSAQSQAEFNPAVRQESIGEIVWAVKSVLQFMPWIRNIYIVVDGQDLPEELLPLSTRILVVHHADIIPSSCLPTFNSDVIESYLHNIPGLSEVFLYNNDDCFFLAPLSLEDFYSGGKVKVKSKLNMRVLRAKTSEYSKRVCLTVDLLRNRHPGIQCLNNHHTKVLRKSTLVHLETEYEDWLALMRSNRFRSDDYIQYLVLALSVDHFLHTNEISYDFRDVAEVHLGGKKYVADFFNPFKTPTLKFACFNSMDLSYKEGFETFITGEGPHRLTEAGTELKQTQ